MSGTNPAKTIPRWSVVGMEGMWIKMWDPPTESPATPDLIAPTNPVPEIMFAKGYANVAPTAPHTLSLDLLHGLTLATWDSPVPVGQPGAKVLNFFTIINPDIPATLNGVYPGTTVRMPCGVIFHCKTSGKGPPPHTIHWHGIEPTPMNDGVGHCSMELGSYTYQWQPSFVGSYFYHCHRNTMQHFEFGLFGLLLLETADTYFATLADPSIPVGHGRDGKRRIGAHLAPTAANPAGFPQFPGYNNNPRDAADPWTGNPALKFLTDPHAQTVPFDVEALWVFDDRDSNWSANASNAFATFGKHGAHPGYDDNFALNPGSNGFFAFNDYTADYWFVTGVPVPTHGGPNNPGTIPAGIVIPPELNSGIVGSQVSVEALVDQTILIRCLDAAYNNCEYTFPVDIVIIAWDGRPLGVPPYGFNEAYLVPANTPFTVSVGRRFDALIRVSTQVLDFAVCKFIDTRGTNVAGFEVVTCVAKVPLNIYGDATGATITPNKTSPQALNTAGGVTFNATGLGGRGSYEFEFWMHDGTSWSKVQNYSATSSFNWDTTTAIPGAVYTFEVHVRNAGSAKNYEATKAINFVATAVAPASGATLVPDKASPQPQNTGGGVTFNAAGIGGSGSYEFEFWMHNGTSWSKVQNYSNDNSWNWDTTAATAGALYTFEVHVRNAGSTASYEATQAVNYIVTSVLPASGATLTPDKASPQPQNTPGGVTFNATGLGGSGSYEFEFWMHNGTSWSKVQNYSTTSSLNWSTLTAIPGAVYTFEVHVRNAGSAAAYEATQAINYIVTAGPATGATLTPSKTSPQPLATVGTVVFTATGLGGSGSYEFEFWLHDGTSWSKQQNYSSTSTWNWTASTGSTGVVYTIQVNVRNAGSGDAFQSYQALNFILQ